ncbi:MAG: hypothetical protein EBE86_030975 [Hormoscilla sp. GUM202]|nr:hypothetical protein [Hormoscilla sp. GUM202]
MPSGVFAKHKEGIAAGDRPPGPSRTETPVSPAEIVPAHEVVTLPDGQVQLVAYLTPGTTPRDDFWEITRWYTMN